MNIGILATTIFYVFEHLHKYTSSHFSKTFFGPFEQDYFVTEIVYMYSNYVFCCTELLYNSKIS